MTISYTFIALVRLALWVVTKWSPAQLIAPWSGEATSIFILAFVCLGLILALIAVVDGARRLYLEAVDNFDGQIADAKADFESRAKNLETLSEVYGGLHELLKEDRRDDHRPTVAALHYWAERLAKALYTCYGLVGTDKFSRGGAYTVQVPETESDQNDWLYKTWQRVEDLIKEERIPSEPKGSVGQKAF